MKFKSILTRLTGFSVPFFGVSWQPPRPDRTAARKLVTFLEDRRVLFSPSELESPDHCVQSVLQIRAFLTQEIAELADDSPLAAAERAMRAACRKFLNSVGASGHRKVISPIQRMGAFDSWAFSTALGELRGVFGVHVAQVAVQYGVDVEADLAKILPAVAEHDVA